MKGAFCPQLICVVEARRGRGPLWRDAVFLQHVWRVLLNCTFNSSQVSTSWLVAADSAEEFRNKPPPLFLLLFILSWKLQVHWHQKSPTSHPPTCMCGTAYSVTGVGSKALLSPWAQSFTSVSGSWFSSLKAAADPESSMWELIELIAWNAWAAFDHCY